MVATTSGPGDGGVRLVPVPGGAGDVRSAPAPPADGGRPTPGARAGAVRPGDAPGPDGVRIRVLGPVEAVGPAGPAKLVGGRQHALLGLLAVAAPAVLPVSRIVNGLWGDDPPRTAVKTLQSHVARVRQALDGCGLPGILRTREPGYLLAVAPDEVDAGVFEAATRRAHAELAAGDPAAAVRRLRAALALWRGDAFAGANPLGWAAAEAARLDEVRHAALGDLWDGQLRLGRHELAVGELDKLLVRRPFDERLVGLAMLALYRCGRHNDALGAYQRLRDHLADELGSEPGPEVAHLHVRILRRDPDLDLPPTAGPEPTAGAPTAELPAPVNHFTGRREHLRALDRFSTDPDIRVLLICGAAGMGKTSLAVRWGHLVASRFPDGQIFCDLRGQDPVPVSPADVLAHALSALDRPEAVACLPESARPGRYRSLTGRRRVLVVADDAGTVEQVLPLVPAGTGALLVVTSRSRLPGLATRHPVGVVELGALRHDEALDLLERVLGSARLADRASAARLVELCGRMPLALQIAAAKLAVHPGRSVADLVDDLSTDRRLDELSVTGDPRSVRAVFATAYRTLSPSSARLFRLLGLHPGSTWSVWLAAAVVGSSLAAARRALDELVAAHLVVEVTNDRYQFHDLVRLYARECGELAESAAARAHAVARLLDWYLAVADAANRAIDRGRDRVVPVLRHPPDVLPFPADAQRALAFLDEERDNLLPVMIFAVQRGRPAVAWQMTYLVTGFFDSRGHWAQRVRICRHGVDAARRAGDRAAEGLTRSGLGVAYLMTHRFDRALGELRRALVLMREHHDRRGEAHVLNNIAVAYAGMRRFDDAVHAYRLALRSHAAQGSALGTALCLNNLGDVYVRMGHPALAVGYLGRALEASRKIDNARLEAAACSGLGQAYRGMGCWDRAVVYFSRALVLRRRAGDHRYEADTLDNLGLTDLARGRYAAARRLFQQAGDLARQIADPHREALALAHLGRAFLRESDLAAAADRLRQALVIRELAPDPFEAAAIRQDLAEAASLLSAGRGGDSAAAADRPGGRIGDPDPATVRPTVSRTGLSRARS